MIKMIGFIASIVLPLWNIPLIMHIVRNKSSRDVSLAWAWGVWGCLGLMLPSGLITDDALWKTFTIVNFVLFSGVLVTVLYYRKERTSKP